MKRAPAKSQVLALVEKQGPICTADLAKILGKTPGAVRYQINRLWKSDPKQIYLAGFSETVGQGRDGRMWAAGNEPDATKETVFVKPKRTPAEIEEAHEQEQEAARRARLLSLIKVRRDPFVEAFFGSPTA